MKQKLLFWFPRVLGILVILLMMMFSLDCIDEYSSFEKLLICFFMNNIPAFIFLVVFIIAWKWELIGGLLICLAAIIGGFFFKAFDGNAGVLIILLPFILVGILFIIRALICSNKK